MPAWGFKVAKASRAAVTSLVRRAITLKSWRSSRETRLSLNHTKITQKTHPWQKRNRKKSCL
jgi:hypothetical protein